MRKWIILITALSIGIIIALGVWFVVKTSPEPTPVGDTSPRSFVSFFAQQFGFGDDDTPTDTSTTTTPDTAVSSGPSFRAILARERMILISPELISGLTFTATTTTQIFATASSSTSVATSTQHSVRFVERKNAHISDLSLETGKTTRITNTTIPRIQEALWGHNGASVALRYLSDDNETIETYVASLPEAGATTTTELSGIFLQQNIASLSMSPTKNELFYLTTADTGATGRITTLRGASPQVIFFSPLREWLSTWNDSNTVVLFSKPSNGVSSIAYTVGTSGDNETTQILTGKRGLTLLPNPSSTKLLYSEEQGSTHRFFSYTVATKESTEFFLAGLPEKCVWVDTERAICAIPSDLPSGMPDIWYQGLVSFNDSFWLLNTTSGGVEFLFSPEQTPVGEQVDAINLVLSSDRTTLAFIDKQDLRGWIADVSEILETVE